MALGQSATSGAHSIAILCQDVLKGPTMIVLGTMTGFVRDRFQTGSPVLRTARGGGLLLAVLLLAGCPGATDVPRAALSGAAVSPARTAQMPPLPKSKPVPRPAVTSTQLAQQQVEAPQVASAPATGPNAVPTAVPTLDPRSIVGLDQIQTRRLLGTPAATEEAPPAKVWRYAKGDCTLEVFFFMDMTSAKDFRALSYDMKSSQNVPDRDTRCFAQLVAQAGNVIHD